MGRKTIWTIVVARRIEVGDSCADMVYNRSDRIGGLDVGGREEGGLDLRRRTKLNAGGAAQLGG